MKFSRTLQLAKNALLIVALIATPWAQGAQIAPEEHLTQNTPHHSVSTPDADCHAKQSSNATQGSPTNDQRQDAPLPTPTKCAYHCLATGLSVSHSLYLPALTAVGVKFPNLNLPSIGQLLDVDLRPPIG